MQAQTVVVSDLFRLLNLINQSRFVYLGTWSIPVAVHKNHRSVDTPLDGNYYHSLVPQLHSCIEGPSYTRFCIVQEKISKGTSYDLMYEQRNLRFKFQSWRDRNKKMNTLIDLQYGLLLGVYPTSQQTVLTISLWLSF